MFVRLILCNTRQSKGQPVPALSQPGRPAVVVVFVGFFYNVLVFVFVSVLVVVFVSVLVVG